MEHLVYLVYFITGVYPFDMLQMSEIFYSHISSLPKDTVNVQLLSHWLFHIAREYIKSSMAEVYITPSIIYLSQVFPLRPVFHLSFLYFDKGILVSLYDGGILKAKAHAVSGIKLDSRKKLVPADQ